ncbi:hypothetical protein BH20VER2_BH20VER2_16590 [soil metagenome]
MSNKSAPPERELDSALGAEFDRQLATLQQKGYAKFAGLTEAQFAARIDPLREQLSELEPASFEAKDGKLPFVLVITRDLVSPSRPSASLPGVITTATSISARAASATSHPRPTRGFPQVALTS